MCTTWSLILKICSHCCFTCQQRKNTRSLMFLQNLLLSIAPQTIVLLFKTKVRSSEYNTYLYFNYNTIIQELLYEFLIEVINQFARIFWRLCFSCLFRIPVQKVAANAGRLLFQISTFQIPMMAALLAREMETSRSQKFPADQHSGLYQHKVTMTTAINTYLLMNFC